MGKNINTLSEKLPNQNLIVPKIPDVNRIKSNSIKMQL